MATQEEIQAAIDRLLKEGKSSSADGLSVTNFTPQEILEALAASKAPAAAAQPLRGLRLTQLRPPEGT